MIKTLVPAVLAFACAATAQGACTQSDIAGTWTAYSVSQDQTGLLAWVSCSLVVSATGAFVTPTSTCSASGKTVQVHGSLKPFAGARCLFNGTIASPGGADDPIPSLTLSLDKQTAIGVSGKNGNGNVSMFSMVKTK